MYTFFQVEMLRMKMEGMSKGMRERMAEYSRRLEAVAGGDNNNAADDCQSRKCGSRHSRKPSASSQRSWSGGSTNAGASRDTAASHGRSRHTVAPEKHHHHHQQHKVNMKKNKFKFACLLFHNSVTFSTLTSQAFLIAQQCKKTVVNFVLALVPSDADACMV